MEWRVNGQVSIQAGITSKVGRSLYTCIHPCLNTNIRGYKQTYMQTNKHAYLHTHIHTCFHPYINRPAYIDIKIHPFITYTHKRANSPSLTKLTPKFPRGLEVFPQTRDYHSAFDTQAISII